MKITAIQFVIGSAIPPLFGWFGSYDFTISVAIVMTILVLTKQIDLI